MLFSVLCIRIRYRTNEQSDSLGLSADVVLQSLVGTPGCTIFPAESSGGGYKRCECIEVIVHITHPTPPHAC